MIAPMKVDAVYRHVRRFETPYLFDQGTRGFGPIVIPVL